MKTYDIAVIGGDGTGPEVTSEALKVSEAAARKFGFKLNWHPFDFGGERYLKTGEVLPDSAVDELRKFKAIFLGAVGHPMVQPGILEKGILLRLRFELEQYINLRPVKLFRTQDCPLKDKGPEHIDFVVVRENNEGLYAGAGGNLREVRRAQHEIDRLQRFRSQQREPLRRDPEHGLALEFGHRDVIRGEALILCGI